MIVKDGDLVYSLWKQEDISLAAKDRMYQLMNANYNHVPCDLFLHDLSNKTWVGMIHDVENEIQGFTTFVINPRASGGTDYNIIFSGDTIIDPAHWGTQILMKGWCYTIGNIISTDSNKKWYWYLLSKGHRTYMYLPLFFKDYYPSPTESSDIETLTKIADESSTKLYGDSWHPTKGVIHFDEHHGELTEELASASFKKSKSPNVAFFLEKNPEFYKGDELVCIAPLYPENLIRTAKEFILYGMENPLY